MKKNVLLMVLMLIVLVVFNVFYYMLGGTDRAATVWISYIFIHVAFILLVITPMLVTRGRDQSTYGLTLGTISAVYFIIELIVGCLFIRFARDNVKTVFLVQLLLLAIYVVILIVNIMANDRTASNVKRQEAESLFVKQSAASVRSIMNMTTDRSLIKSIERAYDIISTSPIQSNRDVASLEYDVLSEIEHLRSCVAAQDPDTAKAAVDKICRIVSERNRQLKLYH